MQSQPSSHAPQAQQREPSPPKSPSSSDEVVGTIIGAGGGAAAGSVAGAFGAGAVAGTVAAGPIGAVVGGLVGAAAGALAGRALTREFDSSHVDAHWSDRFDKEPYYEEGHTWHDYAPAYRVGAAARARYPERSFEESEADMESSYLETQGESRLPWERARPAARASFDTDYLRGL